MESIEQRMRSVATRQDGIFTTKQAHAAGITQQMLKHWIRSGRGQRLHRGVYLMGPLPPSLTVRRRAAALASGPAAVIGGGAALDEYDLERRRNATVVVLTDRSHRSLPGVTFIRSSTLCGDDFTRWNGQRFPTIERVLVDIAAQRSVHELCKIISEATFRDLIDLDRLRRTIERNRRRVGIRRLIDAITRYVGGENGVDSGKENRLTRLFRRAGITGVKFNVELVIHGTKIRVDAYIEHAGLVIELDPSHHLRPDRVREDALRTSLCRSIGLHTIRIHDSAMEAGVAEVVAYLGSRQVAELQVHGTSNSARWITAPPRSASTCRVTGAGDP